MVCVGIRFAFRVLVIKTTSQWWQVKQTVPFESFPGRAAFKRLNQLLKNLVLE